ncbi:alpha/beta hydrolase [Microbacterium sp. MYb64]|uniref:alpha/beta hydrolase n=1 Tax=Microbacterium sp. MYb64 TaxID=1848691 RepID=UPI000CFD7B4A|nr:alpha/beta hydrolase [Microbacterium sp. MYb64]PRB04325.1 hypothetical protein CQ044_12205 [Microbacterium sp. MYb64]
MASPKGYLFERIEYDAGLMNTLAENLGKAEDAVQLLTIALFNTSNELEGRGKAITDLRATASEVSTALTPTTKRITRIKNLVLAYGTDTESHAGRANQQMADVVDAQKALTAAETDLADARDSLSAWQHSDAYKTWKSAGDEAPSRGTLTKDNSLRNAAEEAKTALALARSALDDAWAAWERSFESWDDAYARALAALAGVDDGYASPGDKTFLTSLADADTPAEVAAIWDRLDDKAKQAYAARYPDLIGNLEGVPYAYRIAANVVNLEAASRTDWGDPVDEQIQVLLGELRAGGMPVSLNLFDKAQGTAAMLYVNGVSYEPGSSKDPLAGVTNLTVLLGGMDTQVTHMDTWGETARQVNKSVGSGSATIVWFGYDTPDKLSVARMDQAVTGAESLTSFLRGLDHVAPANAVTTVVGHSYGSTTAFLAVGSAPDDLGVDRLIAIGSAGLTDRALGGGVVDYSGTEIYASTSPEDNWARKGRWAPESPFSWGTHAIDPGSLDGAVNFDSNGGYLPNTDGSEPSERRHDGEELLQTPGHGTHQEGDWFLDTEGYPGGYLDDRSESYANIIGIIKDGQSVTTPGGYGSDDWWLW